jgi:drug/metabolite transporter (DMT)-like permease
MAVDLAVAPSEGLAPLVTVAVLVAAVAHASWNAIAHNITDRLAATTLVGMGGGVVAVLMMPFVPFPHAAAWPYLLVSTGIHLAYMVLLAMSFKLGDFSQSYPIARGTAPVVVIVLAAIFVQEYPSAIQIGGVAVASIGLAFIALAGMRKGPTEPGTSRWPGIAAALGTGLTIAAYTTVDGIGVRHSGNAAAYTAWLLLIQGVIIAGFALVKERGRLGARLRPFWIRGLFGGGISVLAYGLVLWAQTRGALGPIAALRETSIIVGAIIGTVIFKESFGKPRVIATVLVASGIVLLNVG